MSQNTILITGASSGIGKATAKTLIGKGYTVYAAARRVEKMDDLKQLGGIPLKMDISKDEDILAAVKQIEGENGGVDILINNAGFATYGSVEETPLEDARYQFEVNLFGLARLTQLVLPYMRDRQAGKIVNVSSVVGKISVPLGSWYVATKHALEGWSDCLRFEVKPFGIDVIIIEPGAIATEFGDVFVEPMLKRSGEGAYRNIANTLAKFSQELQADPKGSSPPSVIANTIVKAIQASNPKTRYVAGKLSRQMLLARNFGDRFYDWVLGKMIR
ncbi:MAG: SDR family NAD(P)-dependent oxidoreductase [Cyanobacteria bacterium SBLK]|nr:SDR family NAD(P)-dependent oxidoreductase [Cyanobacteria bacterium SBLK]